MSRSVFSTCCKSEEVGPNISEGIPQQQIDVLAKEGEHYKGKSKVFFLCPFCVTTSDPGLGLLLSTSVNPIEKKIPHRCAHLLT